MSQPYNMHDEEPYEMSDYSRPMFGKHAVPPPPPSGPDEHIFAKYKSAKDASPFDFFKPSEKTTLLNPYGQLKDCNGKPISSGGQTIIKSAETGVRFWDFSNGLQRSTSKPGTGVKSVAPIGFVPKCRELIEVFADDIRCKEEYADVGAHDPNLIIYGRQDLLEIEGWKDLGFPDQLLSNIKQCEYVNPRQVQRAAIPLILDALDVLCVTETGSGKTLAYLASIIAMFMEDKKQPWYLPNDYSVYALVVAPTRELVHQIYEQALKFTYGMEISVAKCYGEYDYKANLLEVRNCNLLIATPGRLHHFVKENVFDLGRLRFFVFDEGDTLLGTNHMDDLEPILQSGLLPRKDSYQTLFFSATFNQSLIHAATSYLREGYSASVISERCATNKLCRQEFKMVPVEMRFSKLQQVLNDKLAEVGNDYRKLPQILIFVNTQAMVDELFTNLEKLGFPVAKIRGDFAQNCRFNFFNDFRDKRLPIIVASDVMARGIDLKGIDLVINYEAPFNVGIYIYRVGRVGRIKEGKALSFIDPGYNRYFVRELAEVLKTANHEISQEFEEICQMAEAAFAYAENAYNPGYETNQDNNGANNGEQDPPHVFNESF